MRREPSNVRKRNKGNTKYNKSTITYNIGTAQCKAKIVKCKEKKKEPPNVTKVLSNVMLK